MGWLRLSREQVGAIGRDISVLLHELFAAPNLPADKLAAYQDAIAKMYDTPEWEAVRARNGWVNIYNNGDDFRVFLEDQEKVIGDLMKKLGFL